MAGALVQVRAGTALNQPRPGGPEVNGRLFKTVLMTRSGAVAISQDLIQHSQRGTKPSLKRPTIS
jgi:hypothetical protein